MAPLSITVTGRSTISHNPERGILHVAVKSDGPNKDTVSKEVITTSNQLHQFFKELELPPETEAGEAAVAAPVTTFSSTHLQTWSRVPTDDKNKPLDRVYYASSSFQVIFRDFARMSQVAGKLVAFPKVEIESVDWRLTEETRKSLGSASRREAMLDAIRKAKDYAEVIGCEVVAVEITDEEHGSPGRPRNLVHTRRVAAYASFTTDEDDEPLDLTPQQIEYTGAVQVRFEAVAEK